MYNYWIILLDENMDQQVCKYIKKNTLEIFILILIFGCSVATGNVDMKYDFSFDGHKGINVVIVCLFVCLSVYVSVCTKYDSSFDGYKGINIVVMCICLCVYLSVCLSVCLSICLSVQSKTFRLMDTEV